MSLLSSLSFLSPWVLVALLALPAIWYLLRVTPPAPRRVVFPPLRLLLGLNAPQETPARTPWWLLLLRLIAAALVIFAFAEPILGVNAKISGRGPLVLFIDNGWTAAHAWPARQAAISDALENASRAGRAVVLLPTASAAPPATTLLDAGEAERRAREIEPQSWLPDRKRALAALVKADLNSPEILWLSDGIDYGQAQATAFALSRLGSLKIFSDGPAGGPLALAPEKSQPDGFVVTILRTGTLGTRHGTVSAIGAHGEALASAPFTIAQGQARTTAKLPLPLEVRNETTRIDIVNEDSAGAVRLLDSSSKRRAVGVVAAGNMESEQPLLSGPYYLKRALKPFAEVSTGTIGEALNRNVSVLILADIGRIAGDDYTNVAHYVENGGVLVRFAGARMASGADDLIPVKLRIGGRYLGGALNWSKPQHLAPFPDTSPFRGLPIPNDVTVSRQVLPEPSVDLASRTWARLTDGTPLVTAAQRGKGWIVLFHVTASPAWSNLPLSGLYVDMLHRIVDLTNGAHPAAMGTDAASVFPPLMMLDGFGHLQKPRGEALPVRGSQLATIDASASHPAGLYGREGVQVAVNAVNARTELKPMAQLGVTMTPYGLATTHALEAPLLAIAILLLLIDAAISLWLRGHYIVPRDLAKRLGAVVLVLAIFTPPHARADESFDMKAALDTRLAYVVTGIPDVDEMSKAGLTGLGDYLKARTSYEPEAPIGVDLDKDDLTFFPLLYWPMDPREKDLSPKAISRIQNYMRNGGTILFDTRDLTLGPERGPNSPGEQTLRRLVAKLDLPPLEVVPSDHVLTKTFYLLQDFPGRWAGGKVWIERLPPPDPDAGPEPARGGDGVSPVIIGSNDWAAAWAVDSKGQPLVYCSPGGDEQREMAVRFGINVVMYALTGNYKADLVHAPALLRRLGHSQ